MIITRHSNAFLKFVFGKTTVAFNPVSKDAGRETTRFNADIALSTLAHPCCNGFDLMTSKNNTPFIIKGPGEYEVSDIFIKGYGMKNKIGEEEYMTTSYTLSLDGMNVAFFGQIDKGDDFSNEAFENFLKADIVVVPIGGGDMFTPKEAAKFVKKFDPKMIIPISYGNDELQEFLTIFSTDESKSAGEEKITIKMKDIESSVADIVVLKDLSA